MRCVFPSTVTVLMHSEHGAGMARVGQTRAQTPHRSGSQSGGPAYGASGVSSSVVTTAHSMCRGPYSGVRKRPLQPNSPSPAASAAFQMSSGMPCP